MQPLDRHQRLLTDGSGRPVGGRRRSDDSRPLGGQRRLSADGDGRTVAAIGGRRRLASRRTAAVSVDSGGSWRTADGGGQTAVGLSADNGGSWWTGRSDCGGNRRMAAVGLSADGGDLGRQRRLFEDGGNRSDGGSYRRAAVVGLAADGGGLSRHPLGRRSGWTAVGLRKVVIN